MNVLFHTFLKFTRNKLQLTKEEMYEQIRECDGINYKLREELKEASQTIISRGNELTQNRAELQKHRVEIDVSKNF